MKRYKVYCLRDKAGEIRYVGQTRQPLRRRYDSHKCFSWFKAEIASIELISDFDTIEPMYELERMLIAQYNLTQTGWNKSPGYEKAFERKSAEGESNGFYKQKHSPETIELLRKNSLGNSNAKGNPSRRGRKNTAEHERVLREKKSKPVMCVETGEVFKSGKEAAKKLNLNKSKICLVCQGKRGSTGGYRFIYVQKNESDKSG